MPPARPAGELLKAPKKAIVEANVLYHSLSSLASGERTLAAACPQWALPVEKRMATLRLKLPQHRFGTTSVTIPIQWKASSFASMMVETRKGYAYWKKA
jgi:hypothetical protein